MSFEPGQAQLDKSTRFVARGRGYSVTLAGDEAVLALRGKANGSAPATRDRSENAALRMKLAGANPARLTAAGELPGKTNYFIGNDPSAWRTNVPTYAKIVENQVYPGADLVYYGRQGQLEYDFVVARGADPRAIRLEIATSAGVSSRLAAKILAPQIAPNGDLVVKIDGGEVRFCKPVAYQVDGHGAKQYVDARYVLHGRQSSIGNYRSPITFGLAAYDHLRPLVIDPSLTYSTYLGGSQADVGYGIAVDSSGDTYIAGQTCSPTPPPPPPPPPSAPYTAFPTLNPLAENGASGINVGASCDAFVTKLNPAGTALVYSTYLGGSGGDSAAGIAIDRSGDAYITGTTNSTNFPTTAGAFQPAYGGGDTDDFVTELSAAGTALVYSSYLGGSDSEGAGGIAVDSSGNAYVTGETYSMDFPVTPGSFQTVYQGDLDAFVAKINAGGATLGYAFYLGCDGSVSGSAIAVDSLGSAFVTGSTASDDSSFPVKNTNVQGACGGYLSNGTPPMPPNCPPYVLGAAYTDAFVTKVSSDGSSLVYSTYLGGSSNDVGTGIAVDTLGAAYITGWTVSGNFPFPLNGTALQTVYAGDTDAFVAKIDPVGSQLVYSTYLGGSGQDMAAAIAVDVNGVAYVTGGTTSSNFPTVSPLQPSLAGPLVYPGDAFVAKVNAFGSGLIYSSYLGGGDLDVGNGVAVDSSLAVYVTGSTFSTDFPTTSGAFQPLYAGAGDVFVAKLNALTAAVAEVSPRSLSFGNQALGIPSAPQTVTITNSGDAALLISSIVESGDIYTEPAPLPPAAPYPPVDLKDWDITTDQCTGISVPPGGTCTFTVTFDPNPLPSPAGLGPGARTGTVTLADNATTATQLINLSGDGVAPPAVLVLPASLSFPNTLSGATSASQTITLSNSGGFVLAISSIAASQNFAETNTCGTSLGPGGTCSITVTFSPATSGTITGAISLNDNASTTPQSVTLTGIGTAPVATFSPSSLSFATQTVNSSSAPESVTLSNTGTAALNLTGITLSGTNSADFTLTETCGSSLAAGAGCAISVTFNPSGAGARVAAINIADNAQGSPQMISLTGTGLLAPSVTLSTATLTFASQGVGTTSAPQTVTLTNSGSAALTITGSAATGDFAQTNTCPASLAVKSTCQITVTFTPTASGNRYGSVMVTDNASGSPQTILVAGVGLAAPIVNLSPATLEFGGQALGAASAAQVATLSNTGTAALVLTSISASGDFAQTNTCPATLATGSSCAINVTFAPSVTGTRTGSLTVKDNAAGSPQMVSLGGIGADFLLAISPPSVTALAGNPAAFSVTVSPQSGFNAQVTLTCGHLPPLSTCSVSPSTMSASGSTPVAATLTVNTTVRSWSGPGRGPRWPGLGEQARWTWIPGLLIVALGALGLAFRRRWAGCIVAAVVVLALGWMACGGSGTSLTDPTGTAAGSYTISVTAASGPVSHSVNSILVVQ